MSSLCPAGPAVDASQGGIPHRKLIRGWLLPITRKSTRLAIGLVAIDLALYVVALAVVVLARSAWLQVAGGAAMGFVIARLFILGHHGYTNLKGFEFVWEPQSLAAAGHRGLPQCASVPLYRLKQAQRLLESRLPGRIVVQRFSWCWYADTARRCQRHDFDARCWTDFRGRPTGAA